MGFLKCYLKKCQKKSNAPRTNNVITNPSKMPVNALRTSVIGSNAYRQMLL